MLTIMISWKGDWSVNNQAAFLLLAEGSDSAQIEGKLSAFLNKYYPDSPRRARRRALNTSELVLVVSDPVEYLAALAFDLGDQGLFHKRLLLRQVRGRRSFQTPGVVL